MDLEMSMRVRLGAKVLLVGQAKPFLLSGKSNFLSRFTLTFIAVVAFYGFVFFTASVSQFSVSESVTWSRIL
jgi:hypothetical protein